MKIRRERTDQCGLTNIDFRTKGELDKVDHFNPSLKFTDFGTMSRTKYNRMPSASSFKQQVAISGGWLNSKHIDQKHKDQRYETAAQFYSQKSKVFRAPVPLGKFKKTELDEKKWTDKVFTGDSDKNAAALTFHARQREMNTMNDRYKGR